MRSEETRARNSAAAAAASSSSSPRTNGSLLSSLFAAIDDDTLVEKKRKVEKLASDEAIGSKKSKVKEAVRDDSVYPGVESRSRGGEIGNGSAQDAVALANRANSQQGFVRFGTELTPVLSGLGTQPVGNPYQNCFPYSNMYGSSGVALDLRQKGEDSWNLHNPRHMESLFGNIPSSLYQESVLHAGFVPFQAMFQNPYFPTSFMGPPLNPFQSSLLTKNQELDVCATSRGARDDYPLVPKPVRGHLLNFSPFASLAKSEELNECAVSQGPQDDNSPNGMASVPLNKRKLGSPCYVSNTGITAPIEGKNNGNLEPSARDDIPWLEHNAAEALQNLRPSLVSSSDEPQSRCPTAGNSYELEEEKDLEGKDMVLLVQKELRNTDVGNLGRIVLPKKDAEANLPQLVAKDGVILQMEDMTYSIKWKFKYRYWPNNKSRMYVMENTGDFVRTHNLQTGDFFIVYKEQKSGKYIAQGKKRRKYLHVGENRRSDEKETEAKRKNFVSSNGKPNSTAEKGACSKREPFDLERNVSLSSQFVKPL